MQLVVYLDTYFFINVFMDFVILLIVSRMNLEDSTYTKNLVTRVCLASVLGGTIACLGIILRGSMWLIRFLLFYVLGSFGMILIAFPYRGKKKFFIKLIELYIVTFCMCGLISFLYESGGVNAYFKKVFEHTILKNVSVWNLLEGIGILIVFLPIINSIFRLTKTEQEKLCPVDIRFGNKTVQGLGLIDTGNLLRDPITKKPVLIAQYEWIKNIFTKEQQTLLWSCMKTGIIQELSQDNYIMIRMIPFQSIGKENGLLTAVVVDELTTGQVNKCRKWEKVIVALYPNCLSAQGNYQIILQKDFV